MYIIGLREAKAYGGMEVARSSLYSFLTSVLVVSGQLHASAALLPGVELSVPDQGMALCAP